MMYLRAFRSYLRALYGPWATGRGRLEHATKKGPGRRRVALSRQQKPTGHKRILPRV